MTDVRQLVYDADRLVFLGEPAAAAVKLRHAVERLRWVAAAPGLRLPAAVDPVMLALDEALLALDQGSPHARDKIHLAGRHVNLMLLKGDIVVHDHG